MTRRRTKPKGKRKQSRKINVAKIRPSHTYDLPEIAKSQNRNIATVRRWRCEGMPTIPNTNEQLVDGAEFKDWAIDREAARKRPCAVDEFYCMGKDCRTQRKPAMGSVLIRKTNRRLGSIEAICGICGTKIKKGFAMSELSKTEAALESFIGNLHDLTRYRDVPFNGTSKR